MKLKYLLAASVVSLSAATMVAAPAAAQQITSGIEGQVVNESGAAIPGATVTITDTRTGQSRTLNTDTDGSFRASSLVPGGPYTVTAAASDYEGQTVEDVSITVSGNTDFTFELTQSAAENVIVVTGARANVQQLAVGPGSAFDEATLEAFPSITRDVRDIIRIDPRVSLDRDNEVDRISCLGGNDRSNTFTVDGIVQADVFGLNGTPFAARNSLPLPYDVIRETSVEFAPFDVEYSDFTGCLVNVVTKSGENQFHGSAFFTFRNEDLRGDSIDGVDFIPAAFEEKRWGATLGGPIIPDRLFFYAGYEETDLGDSNDFGPTGAGFPNQATFVTQDQFNQFSQIAQSVYGQDVGGYPRSLPESSVRYFGRLDAYINDDHRIEGTYQRLEETNVETDFGGDNLTGLNSFEDEGTVSDYYSVRLYSNWSDKFSTELRLSRAEVGDVQGPFGFNEAQSDDPTVRLVVGVTGPNGDNGILSTGPGIFRSANVLNNTTDQARFQGLIDGGDHQIKIGAEINDLDVFNLFAINATGSLYFANLDDFAEGILTTGNAFFPDADEIVAGDSYGGDINATPSGDINEAAATFKRTIYSVYAQDDWQATDQLNLTAGLRVQWYDGDAPRFNPAFEQRFGFSNANPFSKLDPVLLPRAAATYEFDNLGFFSNTSVTGGVGIFAGGDPVVFFSNAFSNNGFSTGLGTTLSCDSTPTDVVQGGVFTGFPQCAIDAGSAQAAGGFADTQSTDPQFEVPTVLRVNAGLATTFGTEGGFFSDWRLNLDYIYSKFNDPINFVDLVQTPDVRTNGGFTVDGRPIYQAIDVTFPGCNASLQYPGGTPPTYTNVTPDCFVNSDTGRSAGVDDFIQLTNGDSYESHVASIALSKNFRRGAFTDGGNVRLSLGYAFTDSNNFRNAGSSTATSNYDVTAAFDRQNPAVSTSNFETRHNFTTAVNFREEFFGDYGTQLGLFFSARSGRPYSLAFDGGGVFNDSSSGSDNALLYVPTGPNDPNLSPLSDDGAVSDLLNFLNNTDEQCEFTPGQTISRNSCKNDWYFDLDMRISQELPFLGSLTGVVNDRIELFADFDNFLNLIDDSANVFRRRGGFQQTLDLAGVDVDDEGRYIIQSFNQNYMPTDNDPDTPDYGSSNTVSTSSSVWRIQVGVRYEF